MLKSATSRLTFAVLLSLAVHGMLIMMWPDDNINIPQAGGQTMTVSLVVLANKKSPAQTSVKIPTGKTKNIPAKKKIVQTITKRHSAISPKLVVKKPQLAHSETTKADDKQPLATTVNIATVDSSTQTESHSVSTENTKKQLKSVLRQAFNTHFYYPRMAIRRGWSGEVHFSLRIEANGKLSHIRILKGSGFDLLDTAAMNSLDKVNILPTAMALLNGNSLDLILPVEYRLL